MPSVRMIELSERTHQLRHHLLPTAFDPIGAYDNSEQVLSLSRSFRVLFHAEVETYFEDRVIEIAKEALKSWKERRHISIVSIHLLGFCGRQMQYPPESLKAPARNQSKSWHELVNISDRFERSVSTFIHKITDTNHGVREKNILGMLIPIGVDDKEIDELMLANLEQFGVLRGTTAHSGMSKQVVMNLDPESEYKFALSVIDMMDPIDRELDRLLSLSS